MKFYIREWSEKTIVLMTDAGHVLSYFNSVNEAMAACSDWYIDNASEARYEVTVQYKQADSSYNSVAVA